MNLAFKPWHNKQQVKKNKKIKRKKREKFKIK